MQHVMDDFESACYYGKGVPLSSTTSRPLMKGIQTLIQTNNISTPTNAAAYKPSDLVRDTLQACFNGGGNPTRPGRQHRLPLRLRGLGPRGHAAERGDATSSAPRSTCSRPRSSRASRSSPPRLLRPGTAICLSDPEVRIRLKRPMIDKPRGSPRRRLRGRHHHGRRDRAGQRGPSRLGHRRHRVRGSLIDKPAVTEANAPTFAIVGDAHGPFPINAQGSSTDSGRSRSNSTTTRLVRPSRAHAFHGMALYLDRSASERGLTPQSAGHAKADQDRSRSSNHNRPLPIGQHSRS